VGLWVAALGWPSSGVARSGSNCRWSGRDTTQNRFVSSKPAEAKTSLSTFACAAAGVGMDTRQETSATAVITTVSRSLIGLILCGVVAARLHVSELRIVMIPEPVAQQVQREHGQHDREPGEHRHPPG